MTKTSEQVIRESAFEIIRLIDECGDDKPRLMGELKAPLQRIIARPDLLSLGVKRQGNHIQNTKYLYYDGQLIMSLDEFPKGKRIPPHDHGIWEALAIYKGRVAHTVYQRLDDGTREGYADVRAIDDRELRAGDVAIVAPPADIHTFVALEEPTFSLVVVGGHYMPLRHYFKPEEKTCVISKPKVVS